MLFQTMSCMQHNAAIDLVLAISHDISGAELIA